MRVRLKEASKEGRRPTKHGGRENDCSVLEIMVSKFESILRLERDSPCSKSQPRPSTKLGSVDGRVKSLICYKHPMALD